MKTALTNPVRFRLFFFAAMLVKIIYTRYTVFDSLAIVPLLLGDLCMLVLAFVLIELIFGKFALYAHLTANLLMSVMLLTVVLYFDFYGSIVTFNAAGQIGQLAEVTASIRELLKPDYFLYVLDLAITAVVCWRKWSGEALRVGKRRLAAFAVLLALVSSVHAAYHGDIINEIKKSEKMGIFHYQAYRLIASAAGESRPSSEPVSEETIQEIKGIDNASPRKYEGIARDSHLVAVQLEAFQTFPIGLVVEGREVTPVLNKLIRESYYFPRFFQQIGRGNTSDAEFIMNTGLYPVGDAAMSEVLAGVDIPSLPRLLKSLGYETLTFHTNDVSFWQRNDLYASLGFDRYYDKAFFKDEDFIAFGSSDEVLYEKALPELYRIDRNGRLFYAHLVAMSSHHPFKIPDGKPTVDLPDYLQNTPVGNYLKAVSYADFALGELIAGLKMYGLWDKTMLVVYGDHFGLQLPTERDRKMIDELLGRPYDAVADKLNVPLLIRVPGQTSGSVLEQVGGQVDIVPTIANLLGLTLDGYIHFGQDLLNHTTNLLGNRFYLPTGSFITDDLIYVPGERFEDGRMIPLNPEVNLPDLESFRPKYEQVLKLLAASDSHIYNLLETGRPGNFAY